MQVKPPINPVLPFLSPSMVAAPGIHAKDLIEIHPTIPASLWGRVKYNKGPWLTFLYLFFENIGPFCMGHCAKQSQTILHCDKGLTASDKNVHLPVLEHDYLGIALPSLHSSALNYADIPFCQVKQAQNCVKKTPVFPVQFISVYKEKYWKYFVFLCLLAVTQQNSSPKQVPGMPLCISLQDPAPTLALKEDSRTPQSLPLASVGKRECSPGSPHTVPSAGDGSVQLWYQSRCHWITQFPQNLATSGPEQMMCQAHPCQLQHPWCPELKRGMEKSSAGSTMLMVLLPVLNHSRKICRHRSLQHTNLALAAGEHWAEGQNRARGRQAGLCSSCDSSVSSSDGENIIWCVTLM